MLSSAVRKTYLNWIFWFFTGNVVLFWMIGLHYFSIILPFHLSASTLTNQFIAWFFLLSAFLGQLGLFAGLAAILPTIIAFLYPKKTLIFSSSIILAFVFAWLLCFDTFIFSQYRFHINGVIWNLVTSKQATEFFDLSWLEWLTMGLLSTFLLGLEVFLAALVWKKLRHKPLRSKYPLYLIGCLLFSYYMLALTVQFAGALSLNQQAYTIPLYYEILSKFLPGNRLPALESLYRSDFVEINHAKAKLHYPLHPLIYQPKQKPLNIVFILIDTWRFDMLNPINTPNIYRFAQESWQFQQHFSGGNGTQPGIFSLFYSLPATYWTATINEHKGPVFIDKLLDDDYHMGIFASASLLAPPFEQNVFSKIKNLETTTAGHWPFNRDQEITSEFKQFITHTSEPFFSFLFYDAAHSFCYGNSPARLFQPSITVCDRLTYTNATNPIPTFNRYKNALYYIDELVAKDLALLKKRHLLDNTIVVITGDHGNEFNDNHLGYWGHASNFTHYQTQTPLIIHWPDKKPTLVKHLTTHYDIVPTLLNRLFGCQNHISDYSIGQSLFDTKQRPYLLLHSYTNVGIIKNKRIITIYPSGTFQVQDLRANVLPTNLLPMKTVLSAIAQTKRFYVP